MRLYSGNTVKEGLAEFTDRLDVRCERKKVGKIDSEVWVSINGLMSVPLTKTSMSR